MNDIFIKQSFSVHTLAKKAHVRKNQLPKSALPSFSTMASTSPLFSNILTRACNSSPDLFWNSRLINSRTGDPCRRANYENGKGQALLSITWKVMPAGYLLKRKRYLKCWERKKIMSANTVLKMEECIAQVNYIVNFAYK